MKTCVFVGPSAGGVELPAGFDRYTPAACGAVWRAVEQGYERIAVVDGSFGNVPAVWHKEVLYALAHGVHVLGASSMGALRAAELRRHGMIGVGLVYRFVRAGLVTADDEVFVSHASSEGGFAPRTLPLVAIRRTLAKLARQKRLAPEAAQAIAQTMKRVHYSKRTWETLQQSFELAPHTPSEPHASSSSEAFDEFRELHVDLQVADYRKLIDILGAPLPRLERPDWSDLHTRMWQTQFADQARDIPPLERW